MNAPAPIQFEFDNIVAAHFMMRVFAAGGVVRRKGRQKNRLVAYRCEPYAPCPCGSGKKVKFCHKQFTNA